MVDSELRTMMALDEHHWWYRGRRRVLAAELDRLGLRPGCRILDAGCGSGRMLDDLAERGSVTGVDLSPVSVSAARDRGHTDVRVGRLEQLPARDGEFDLVTCLDVLEHTPDDRVSLRELLRVTRPGGRLLVSVPAYQALWSSHDVRNDHYRRYTRAALRTAAFDTGWAIEEDTYFNAFLLAPAAAFRLLEKLRPPSAASSDLNATPPRLNRLLERPMRAEAALIGRGVRLAAGLSFMAVLVNPEPVVPAPLRVAPRANARRRVARPLAAALS
jgi:SAM-dependent methyltransferase